MNWIESFFVRAKHLQIFLLFVVVFAVGEFPIIGNFSAAVKPQEGYAGVLFLTQFATVVADWCFLLWLWSLGSFLDTLVRPPLRLNKKLFLFAVIYSAVDAFVTIAIFQSIDPKLLLALIVLTLPALYCIFYNLYFVAKNLVMAETSRSASFSNYAGALFLLWLFLIGAWFIQPRINRLYAEKRTAEATA